MTHGAGGRAMAQLIEELFVQAFDNEWLRQMNDQACFEVPAGRMVMATDSHVVSPLFFPGGDIGSLSVHGTINDVAMSGARPLYLAAGFILEEGFPLADLKRIVESMAAAAQEAGVPVITGDTKVVERGKGDGVFITTTGIGVVPRRRRYIRRPGAAGRPFDRLRNHGRSWRGHHVVSRESFASAPPIRSDTAALHGLVAAMVQAVPGIRCLRDPTRGGLATTLNEFARQSGRRACVMRGVRDPGAAAGERGLRTARAGSAVRGQRGQAGRGVRARRTPGGCSRRCGPIRWGARRQRSAR